MGCPCSPVQSGPGLLRGVWGVLSGSNSRQHLIASGTPALPTPLWGESVNVMDLLDM